MSKLNLLFTFCFAATLYSQKDVFLRLNHVQNESSFAYNENFESDGNLCNITRLQYFLSSIKVSHDGGQETLLNDVYVLANGHIKNYYLGKFNFNTVDSISFDVGVDSIANHGNTTNYPSSHPLGPKSPSMDWGWPSGYFFLVIDGFFDSDNDNNPETQFQLHALGDQMLTAISPISIIPQFSGDTIYLELSVHVDRFLTSIDLANVGTDHSGSQNNLIMCNNSENMNVFETSTTLNINPKEKRKNSVYIDYSLPFAPTINYHFDNNNNVSLNIYDTNGKILFEEKNLKNEGSYFPLKEFATGTYIIKLNNGIDVISKKFLVLQ